MDNLITGTRRNLAHLEREPRFDFIEADICDPLDRITGPIDAVLDFASPASPIDYLKHPFETLHVGSHGVENALRLAKARALLPALVDLRGVRRSAGAPAARGLLGEREPHRPARRVRRGEALRRGDRDGLPALREGRRRIARIFNTYGPRMRLDDGRVVPTFVAQALRGEPLTVFGDGTQTRSFCYVDDNVEGIWRLLRRTSRSP